jgi:hypothetical protein
VGLVETADNFRKVRLERVCKTAVSTPTFEILQYLDAKWSTMTWYNAWELVFKAQVMTHDWRHDRSSFVYITNGRDVLSAILRLLKKENLYILSSGPELCLSALPPLSLNFVLGVYRNSVGFVSSEYHFSHGIEIYVFGNAVIQRYSANLTHIVAFARRGIECSVRIILGSARDKFFNMNARLQYRCHCTETVSRCMKITESVSQQTAFCFNLSRYL